MESQISVHFIHNVTTLPHFWVPTRSPVDDTISCNTFFKVPLRPCQSFCFYKIRIMYENFLSHTGLSCPFYIKQTTWLVKILLQGYYLHPAASCTIYLRFGLIFSAMKMQLFLSISSWIVIELVNPWLTFMLLL